MSSILSACNPHPAFIGPPPSLLQDCPETDTPMVVNGDLVKKVRSLRVDLKNCNADKAALRKWSADMGAKGVPKR